MAESERVATVRASFDAYRRGDFDALAEQMDPEIELHDWPEAADPRVYHGRDGILQARDEWSEAWEYMYGEPTGFVEAGDRVFAFIRMTGKGRGSAIEMTMDTFGVYTFRGSRGVPDPVLHRPRGGAGRGRADRRADTTGGEMSRFEDPVIITCSISGAVANREQCPAIPYTPEEYAAEARRIVDEGGAMIHIHARTPDGVPSYEVEDFRNITDAILSEVDDVIINYSTGAVGVPIEKRLEYLRELRPRSARSTWAR